MKGRDGFMPFLRTLMQSKHKLSQLEFELLSVNLSKGEYNFMQ